MNVFYFQRKPRKDTDFSLEFHFKRVRCALADRVNCTVVEAPVTSNGLLGRLRIIAHAWRYRHGDVLHNTGDIHFANFLLPRSKNVLTILDCGLLANRSTLERLILRWIWLTLPCWRASVVTVISEATKRELLKEVGIPPKKIEVIPIFISKNFVAGSKTKPFNKVKPIVLQVGTAPNKNIERLIEAMAGVSCHLDFIGTLNSKQLKLLDLHNVDYSNSENLSQEEVIIKYQQCDLLAFASTYEGFGMPIIEANATEKPIVTSNILSMPEVGGDAACYVDPYSVEDIRRGILRVIENDGYRNRLVENGRKNRQRFSEEQIANQYYEVYRKLLPG